MNTQPSPGCPLCRTNGLLKEEVIAEAGAAYLLPAHSSPGNYLIIPNEHTEALTDLPDGWWQSVKELLKKIPGTPAYYNMSINFGQPAGQTVSHLHFWVIPRAAGLPSSGKGFARLIAEADNT